MLLSCQLKHKQSCHPWRMWMRMGRLWWGPDFGGWDLGWGNRKLHFGEVSNRIIDLPGGWFVDLNRDKRTWLNTTSQLGYIQSPCLGLWGLLSGTTQGAFGETSAIKQPIPKGTRHSSTKKKPVCQVRTLPELSDKSPSARSARVWCGLPCRSSKWTWYSYQFQRWPSKKKATCWCELLVICTSFFGVVGGLLSSGRSSPKSVLRTVPYGVVENGPFLITCGAKIRVAGRTEGRIFKYIYLRRRPLMALKTRSWEISTITSGKML